MRRQPLFTKMNMGKVKWFHLEPRWNIEFWLTTGKITARTKITHKALPNSPNFSPSAWGLKKASIFCSLFFNIQILIFKNLLKMKMTIEIFQTSKRVASFFVCKSVCVLKVGKIITNFLEVGVTQTSVHFATEQQSLRCTRSVYLQFRHFRSWYFFCGKPW